MRKPPLSLRNIRSEFGTTLTEAMFAAAILGVMGIGMSRYFSGAFKAQKQAEILAAMEFLAQDIENKLKSPSSIYLSLLDAGNTGLSYCVLGVGQGCNSALTTPGARNRFALNYATGLRSAKRATLAGAFQYYDTNGLPCTQGSTGCVFYAETFFYATCDPADVNFPQCLTGPVAVHLGYSVKKAKGALKEFPDVFKDLPLSPRFYTHQTKDILGLFSNATCALGAVVSGYDRRGFAICECKSPYIKKAETRYGPLCVKLVDSQLTCTGNLVYRGVKSDGTALCENPSAAYTCLDAGPDLAARCPTGYWVMQDMRPSAPRAAPYTTACPKTYWERNEYGQRKTIPPSPGGCYFACTLPDIRSGSWDCGSTDDLIAIDRCGAGQQGVKAISGNVVPLYNTVDVPDTENPPAYAPYTDNYKKGLICPFRRLMCCTQSD